MGLTKAERYNRKLDKIWEEARKNGIFDEETKTKKEEKELKWKKN